MEKLVNVTEKAGWGERHLLTKRDLFSFSIWKKKSYSNSDHIVVQAWKRWTRLKRKDLF